jgi:predicted DNA-binding WGR domain protein
MISDENQKDFSLGIKFSISGEKNKEKNFVMLESPEKDDAYYSVTFKNYANKTYDVLRHYGKKGTQGDKERHVFNDYDKARKFFDRKIKDKIKRGYREVNN